MIEESILVRIKETFSFWGRHIYKITMTNRGWHLSEFKFSTGHTPTHFSRPAWEHAVAPKGYILVVHKMTSGCIQMNLLHLNSYVFVSPWIRKYAVSVWSPWFHGHYCLGEEEEMVPIHTAVFFGAMHHWSMEQHPPHPAPIEVSRWRETAVALLLAYSLTWTVNLSLGFPICSIG